MVFYVEEGGGGVNGVNLAAAVGMGLDVELGQEVRFCVGETPC